MIYTKQSTQLAVDNSEMAVIGLSPKYRQPCVYPLIDHGSRPLKICDWFHKIKVLSVYSFFAKMISIAPCHCYPDQP